MATKRLFRSDDNKVIAGILGGFGEYLDIDPVLLRVLYAAVTIFTGLLPGIVVYIVALFIVPQSPRMTSTTASPEGASSQPQ